MGSFKKNREVLLALCLCSALVNNGYAAETSKSQNDLEKYVLDEYVVTATKTALSEKKVPMATEVITQEKIKNLGAYSVRDALRMSIGLDVQETGMTGNVVQIRGMNNSHALILIDGRRMAGENTSVTANVYELSRININDVERIEIVRGPGSALYGSDAMGGVINIITKKATDPSASIGVYTGSKEMGTNMTYASGKQGNLSFKISGNLEDIRKQVSKSDGVSTNMYGPRRYLNLSANYDLGKNRGLDFDASFMKEQFTAFDSSNIEWYNNNRSDYSINYYGKDDKNNYNIRAYYNTLKKANQKRPSSNWNGIDWTDWDRSEYNTLVIEGKNSSKLTDQHTLTYGAEYSNLGNKGTRLGAGGDKVYQDTLYGISKPGSEKNLETYSAYIQDEWQINDRFFVVPSIRFDNHSSFGSHVSPKIGSTYNLSDNSRLKINYGKGYRAPSIAELYYSMDRTMGSMRVQVLGNPDLEPEESTSFDISIEGEKGKAFTKLGYFHNNVKNLIESGSMQTIIGPGMPPSIIMRTQYENISEAEIDGIEGEVGYSFNNNWQVKATYTYLDARDKSDNSFLNGRAKHNGTVQLVYSDNKPNPLTATLWSQWYVDYLSRTTNNSITYDNEYTYNTLNFIVNKQFTKNFRAYAGVDNIFDKTFNIDDNHAYDIDGRTWRLGAEWTF